MKKILTAVLCACITCSLSCKGTKDPYKEVFKPLDKVCDSTLNFCGGKNLNQEQVRDGAKLFCVGATCFGLGWLFEFFGQKSDKNDPLHTIYSVVRWATFPLAAIAGLVSWRYNTRCKSSANYTCKKVGSSLINAVVKRPKIGSKGKLSFNS